MRIKKNDTVMIIKGKDNGKSGRVMRLIAGADKAIVEGLNFVKKHARKTQQNPQGGIIQIESPIALSNLMPVCPKCNKPVRVGSSTAGKDGKKTRICRKCKEALA
ncbi:MAG TPA: 50S ribosomal protein L24 [Candidatus Omnitrophota bacterium]|nr:50S ribosomal protein L24 [Candidatus Omnitrophota bacterium]HPN66928.1 50S ribosomal protein L24 [Candidatus Omnitrophota bacterium]HRZ66622.1 50S ribosomal protein L24 [Candidatus Omnitrophota bacterium]